VNPFPPISELPSQDDDELRRLVRVCGRLRSQLVAFEAGLLAEISRRTATMPEGAEGAVARGQRGSRAAARRRARKARALDSLAATRSALERGDISEEHADTLVCAAGRQAAAVSDNEDELLDHARRESPEAFADRVRRFEDEVEGDDGVERFNRQRRRRKLTMHTRRDDGMTILHGEFDPVAGARIRRALGVRAERGWRADAKLPLGRRRTPEQRLADALEELCGSDGEPGSTVRPADGASAPARSEATVMVVADLDRLTATVRAGRARLADGTDLPIDTIRRLACDGEVLPAIFGGAGQPLWLGRRRRLATEGQRVAVIARDSTCIGCDTPAEWCQVHHIRWWRRGGTTDVDNMCLVCSHHHHLVHEGGWTIEHLAGGGFELRPPPEAGQYSARRSA
jgi:hypothetical protein